jgi:hypothetical protein
MKDEALKLALEALSSIDIYLSDTLSGRVNPDPATHKQWLIDGIIEARNRSRAAITAIKQAVALDKMADNARELGLDYEPVLDVSLIDEGKTAAPVQEPVALRPEDVTVEVLMVQSGGGFAPLKTHGVKLTHKPTGIVVQCSSERSQHRNREQALRDLERYLHGARPQPTPPAQPAPVQEPVAFFDWYDNAHWGNEDFKEGCHRSWNAALKYTTPPAAQPAPVQEPDHGDELTIAYMSGLHDGKKLAAQPAVPDAIHHTYLSEHPQYIEGWNDCRAEMLKGMKP